MKYLCLSAAVLSALSIQTEAAGLLQRTLSASGKAGSSAKHAAAAARAHRRTQVNDWGTFVNKAFSGERLDVSSLKLLQDADMGQLSGDLMRALVDQVPEQSVGQAFKEFKILATMPAYKDFVASGSTDPAEMLAAQVDAFKGLASAALDTVQTASGEGGPNAMFEDLLAEGNPDLQKDMDDMVANSDTNAFHRIQQAFADKFLGGVDLLAMYDNDWVVNRRAEFLNDPNLSRLMDDKGMISILSNENVKMLNPSIMDKGMEGMMEALAHFLPETS